ncbi:MAG: PD40 domain-containing protein [Cytophagaceae bacterium]|nr:PD40 domain-containing protein [Gemmatimonadaceae bacterium]
MISVGRGAILGPTRTENCTMMTIGRPGLAAILVWFTAAGCAHAPLVRAPYAVDPPLDRPTIFADSTVTTVNGIAFAHDARTIYVSRWVPDRDSTGRQRLRIFEHRYVNGGWSQPTPAPFSSAFTDYQPVMSPDGARLYFQSTRPLAPGTGEVLQNLWFVERRGDGWGPARPIDELNTGSREGYAAPLIDGTLYFNSDRPGGRGLQDFYRARWEAGRYSPPVPVRELNTPDSENDLVVDPRGRFVIFNRYIEATRGIDLYVAFRDGDDWGTPRKLDAVNGPEWELTPSISPDGRYFFYTVNTVIHQVDLAALFYEDEPVPGRLRR